LPVKERPKIVKERKELKAKNDYLARYPIRRVIKKNLRIKLKAILRSVL
jgi:hypothetical protein